MNTLASLCLDLFLLGHAHLAAGQTGDGFAFERRVRAHLGVCGLPDARGFRVLGRRSLSGLYHQLDEQTECGEALVVGEWKAWSGRISKNELLRFKAATDDYWLGAVNRVEVPVVRVFGGTHRPGDRRDENVRGSLGHHLDHPGSLADPCALRRGPPLVGWRPRRPALGRSCGFGQHGSSNGRHPGAGVRWRMAPPSNG